MDRTRTYLKILLLTTSFLGTVFSQVPSGGPYTLDQFVIAGGGDLSCGGPCNGAPTLTVTGTVGQNLAGTRSTGAGYALTGGFWQGSLVPTAAHVTVGGRVLASDGRAVGRAIVIFAAADGTSRTSISNYFGYYQIDGLNAGEAYLVTVSARRLQFTPRVVMVTDNLADLDLVML